MEHVLDRACSVRSVAGVILCTSTEREDDQLARLANAKGVAREPGAPESDFGAENTGVIFAPEIRNIESDPDLQTRFRQWMESRNRFVAEQKQKGPPEKGASPWQGHYTRGTTPTGERVEVHETRLNPGGAPHPPHRHPHSEFWLIKEGTVELTINGKQYKLGPGSAAFAASNDEHGIKNAGDVPAAYFVVAIGPMPAPKA